MTEIKKQKTFNEEWKEFKKWLDRCPVHFDNNNSPEMLVETYNFHFTSYKMDEEENSEVINGK